MSKLKYKKKILFTFLIVAAALIIIEFGLFAYKKYFDGWVSFQECEKRGGMVINSSPDYSTSCPSGKRVIGRIEDSAMWKICCK